MAPPHPDPLVAAFARTVARDPSRTLLRAPGQRISAADLDDLSQIAGAALADAPPAPGEPVSFHSASGAGFVAGLIALLRAGAAPVLLDSRTPPSERARISTAMGAARTFSCDCAWPTASGHHWHLGPADPMTAARRPTELPPGTVVKLTSGTTGTPRGILTPTHSLLADDAALRATMGIAPDDRLLAAIPLSHSYGLSSLVLPLLTCGQRLVLPGPGGPFAPLRAAAEAAAEVFPTVPAYLAGLLRMGEPPPLPPSISLVLTAGAPLTAETSARFHRRYGLPVHVFYGASECGGICYDREGGAAERGTVGLPVGGVEIELDEVAGETAGRVCVRSAAVSSGYLPAEPSRLTAGRYVSEDLAQWRGGELALCGRLGDIINVRGKKVDPREVESVLRRLPAVDDAAVLSVPASASGGAEGRVQAVVASTSETLTRQRIHSWCREHLADHKRPRSVLLVDRLPRTERGKLDRAALELLASGDG